MKLFEILQNMSPEQAYEYATIHGPTPELEDIIASDAVYSYLYADEVLHMRFYAGEKAIANDAWSSYWYAYRVLNSRFPKGEKAILKDPANAYWYAEQILGRRWLKAEPLIRNNLYYWKRYKIHFNIK